MNTTIQKSNKQNPKEDLLILASEGGSFDKSIFSTAELKYVTSEIKKKNKVMSVNQPHRMVFLHIIDCEGDIHKITEAYRMGGNDLAARLNSRKIRAISIISDCDPGHILAYAEGICLGNYQFLKYKTDKTANTLKAVKVVHKKITAKSIGDLTIICDAVCCARDLVNEPLNGLNATGLAKTFQKMGKEAGFKVTVFDKKKIKSLGMGGLLAVNLGSIDPPTFTVMEYKSPKAKNKKPIVLVGKGVVYDTGGLSLKPTANSMDYMKSDMGGSAVVGSAIYAIAKLKLPVHVIALVPATDNRPDGNAYTPGDVIKMYDGSTVEVLNTDAEGRMILADALHHAKKFKPQLVMEFSTLTGAAANAIGKYGIVCMGDAPDSVKQKLNDAGKNVYERLVEFPFWDEYDELIKSDIADMKNIGGAVGGAITAGRFLSKFTDYPYMHFDIAGPAYGKSRDSYRGKNGTGVGVRMVCEFIKNVH
jgi:leucyl aminopeptidase